MKKVKTTVLRRSLNDELVREYGVDEMEACSALKEGEVFYSGLGIPRGLGRII